MPRLLIISEFWPSTAANAADERLALAEALAGAGFRVDVVTSDRTAAQAPGTTGEGAGPVSMIRIPFEPPRTGGALWGLRNALFFDAAANPGNYALLRDRLHMHLQEVLYDAVIILCPPQIYLRLGYWIGETFGIPVWIHLTQVPEDGGHGGFAGWNRRRLRKKYLASARLLTVGQDAWRRAVPGQDAPLLFAVRVTDGLRFQEPGSDTPVDVKALLGRIVRKRG